MNAQVCIEQELFIFNCTCEKFLLNYLQYLVLKNV